METLYQIRATYDRDTITIWQAYSDAIADPALKTGRFQAPFSLNRMTWIKPSFLWLMHRSNFGHKPNQNRILAVKISRSGWEEALSQAILTEFDPKLFKSREIWADRFKDATVHLQWDPERNIRGAALNYYSIQIGISRHLIKKYVDEWVVSIEDFTPTVQKIDRLIRSGKINEAKKLLPVERIYPLREAIARPLKIAGTDEKKQHRHSKKEKKSNKRGKK